METETLVKVQECWTLLDQLAAALVAVYNPSLSCPAPFSSLIDSLRRSRIEQWIEMQDGNLLQAVFSGLLQLLAGKNESVARTNPDDRRLRKIHDYVHRHYSGEISLRKPASDIGLSESAFCRFFMKATGEHFTGYVNKVRIEYAARQLRETGDSVSEIGYGCGFNTIDYFIRIFKKVKGCTPGQYRKAVES